MGTFAIFILVFAPSTATEHNVLSSMDPTTDPCEDFPEYVCGHFYKKKLLPQGAKVYGSPEKMHSRSQEVVSEILNEPPFDIDPDYLQKLKAFLSSCLNRDKIRERRWNPLKKSAYFRMWPILKDNYSWHADSSFDLNAAVDDYMRDGLRVFFTFKVTTAARGRSRHLRIGPPRFMFLRNTKALKNVQRISKRLQRLGRAAGIRRTLKTKLEMQNVTNLLLSLANASNARPVTRWMTLSKLGASHSFIDIPRALRASFSVVNISLADNHTIRVFKPSYFDALDRILGTTNSRIVLNFMGFSAAYWKSLAVRAARWRIRRKPLAKYNESCFVTAKRHFRLALSKEYIKRAVNPELISYVKQLAENIRHGFGDLVREAEWISNLTRNIALKKLNNMLILIGHQNKNFEQSEINKFYHDLKMTPDKYYENMEELRIRNFLKLLKALAKVPKRSQLTFRASGVTPTYYVKRNILAFPGGALQPPLVSLKFPRLFNIAGIGTAIAHEIAHGFTGSGLSYDGTEKKGVWMPTKDMKKYLSNARCLLSHSERFVYKPLSVRMNAAKTVSENLADVVAIRASFRAYKDSVKAGAQSPEEIPGLTNDQAFFVYHSQIMCTQYRLGYLKAYMQNFSHAPDKYRIMGPLQNMPAFAEVFNCTVGSQMNPQQKCVIW